MAERLCFIPTLDNKFVNEEVIEFKYHSGFAVTQKQKSIQSLHSEIQKKYPKTNILEISSKSKNELGVRLSAFNLELYNREKGELASVESIFQSSKVFEYGGPYKDLLYKSSLEAKKDIRIKDSGNLLYFDYCGARWDLEPKTMFYDYIYISALIENEEVAEELLKYNCFTDIEFNHKKSINCQARAAAIFVSLKRQNKLSDFIKDLRLFESIYLNRLEDVQQSLFD